MYQFILHSEYHGCWLKEQGHQWPWIDNHHEMDGLEQGFGILIQFISNGNTTVLHQSINNVSITMVESVICNHKASH